MKRPLMKTLSKQPKKLRNWKAYFILHQQKTILLANGYKFPPENQLLEKPTKHTKKQIKRKI